MSSTPHLPNDPNTSNLVIVEENVEESERPTHEVLVAVTIVPPNGAVVGTATENVDASTIPFPTAHMNNNAAKIVPTESSSIARIGSSTTTTSSQQLQRPKPQQNRLYSQSSFHAMDFDCYDVNDCYNYSLSAAKEAREDNPSSSTSVAAGSSTNESSMKKKAHKDGTSPSKISKSSSSNNIAVDVQALFQPQLSSSHQSSLFRSTSSESIAMKQRLLNDTSKRQQHHSQQKIILGICAMDKKAQSQPMKEILSRLDTTGRLV
jgi:hypothetical protein